MLVLQCIASITLRAGKYVGISSAVQPLGCSIFAACCKISSLWRVTAGAIKMHVLLGQKVIVQVLDFLDLKVWVWFSLSLALQLYKTGNSKILFLILGITENKEEYQMRVSHWPLPFLSSNSWEYFLNLQSSYIYCPTFIFVSMLCFVCFHAMFCSIFSCLLPSTFPFKRFPSIL